MKVYVVGNELVPEDSMPFRLLSLLRKEFPSIKFEEADPNENFIPEEDSIIIDTIKGIKKVTLFETLDMFEQSARISPHDYDLLLHLQLLKKLKKLTSITIIGIPMTMSVKEAGNSCIHLLQRLQTLSIPGRPSTS